MYQTGFEPYQNHEYLTYILVDCYQVCKNICSILENMTDQLGGATQLLS